MPLSNSVIRRYTPPTCTLEVLAQSSPLSRWMGKTVLKQLSFELRFDDPRLPEDRRVPIRGDRDQLEALCDAVTSYVQEFLQQSPESFWVTFSGSQESNKVLDEPEESKNLHPTSLSAKTLKSLTSQIPGVQIRLEPNSYLTHNLFLGSLANQASGRVIQLSLLQLFDLASALDEYSADVMVLPTLSSSSSSSSSLSFPTWAPVAAVLVLALGLTPVTWQYANNIRQKQQQTAKTIDPTETDIAALESSPSLNFPTPQSGLIPQDNFQSSLPPLGSTPALPTSSLPPKPLIAPNSNFSTQSQISPNSSLPTTPKTSPNSNFSSTPLLSPKDPLTLPQTKTPTLPTNPRSTALTKIPGQETAIQPKLGQNPAGSIPQAGIALPEKQNLPSSAQTEDSLARVSPENKPSSTTSPRTTENNPFIDGLGDGRKVPTPPNVATGTLFDTPQIAEAREYISKRWQPPARLGQTLEYSLLLSVDGKIERIFPLNKAAREFVDSAGMPDIGKPFVSANKTGQNLRIRVVLSPDGKVQTFPESE
ncbi:DUF4335 domain-containing protein [Komarekiella sp. 'clone 1']|uniref:DUF4335 domain-containing protein n=1 Tax=Komarekiella delphini-convector SJRDD-AB1 TaxID=2593771 RepID=A0AA40VPT7_9NOST|nr:DUF4335 domain-containing protein [Komarekiella delphini-convector]MBD6615105.1 DUF4335 domain-containing protein [Komarekiella delphini-convector SJRDD-AB1]